MADYWELQAFAQFASDLDRATQAKLNRGTRIVEVLKQRQFTPYPVEDQVMSIWAATNGFLDDLPIERVQDFESGLLDHLRGRHSGIGETIRDTGKLEDDTIEKLRKAVQDFKDSYAEQVETVDTAAAEEGVPEVSDSPAAEGEEDEEAAG